MHLVGASHISIETHETWSRVELEYEDNGTHELKRRLTLSGTIRSENTTRLLLNGDLSISGMPISVHIEIGAPYRWDEHVANYQTKNIPDGLPIDQVKERLGNLYFVPAYDFHKNTCEAQLTVPEAVFNDLVAWIRMNWKLSSLGFDVYGQGMQLLNDPVEYAYNWTYSDTERFPLHIANFTYAFAQTECSSG